MLRRGGLFQSCGELSFVEAVEAEAHGSMYGWMDGWRWYPNVGR